MSKKCSVIAKSLDWCSGTRVTPGIRRRFRWVPYDHIAKFPTLEVDELGNPVSETYTGNFELVEGAKWLTIDHLVEKAEFSSQTQGTKPSATFLNTVKMLHPGIGKEAAAATAGMINIDIIGLVEDMQGNYRVVGSENYPATATVERAHGTGATGEAGTTITVTGSDIVDAPFYEGEIVTDDGTINETA